MLDRNIQNKRVNRQPTLHEYGFFCCKLRLNDNYTIGYPLQLCGPLGADFDGDTVTVQLVPPEAAEETYARMSPRYTYYYKKNGQPIFEFNHETLNGLAVVSQYTPDDPSELKDPRYYYTSYEDVLRDAEVEKKIKIGTPICFTGEVGGVKYTRKITTYGRLRLSKILEADIDKLKIFDNPEDINSRITANAAAKLSAWLNGRPDDGIEKRQKIQKFALQKVTQAGVVTFDYNTLYVDTNTETYQKIKKIVEDPELTDKQKTLMMNTCYKKYQKEVEAKFSDDLKKELSLANRVKLASITAMTMPGFIISGVEEKPKILKGTLLDGMSEEDYQFHTIENRALTRIKQDGVSNCRWLGCVIYKKRRELLELV